MHQPKGGGLKRGNRPASTTERLPEMSKLPGADKFFNNAIPWKAQHLVARHGVTIEAAAVIAGLLFAEAGHG